MLIGACIELRDLRYLPLHVGILITVIVEDSKSETDLAGLNTYVYGAENCMLKIILGLLYCGLAPWSHLISDGAEMPSPSAGTFSTTSFHIHCENLVHLGDLRLIMEYVAFGGSNSGIENEVNYGPMIMNVHQPTTLQSFVALTLVYQRRPHRPSFRIIELPCAAPKGSRILHS